MRYRGNGIYPDHELQINGYESQEGYPRYHVGTWACEQADPIIMPAAALRLMAEWILENVPADTVNAE